MGRTGPDNQKEGIHFLGELTALLSHDLKNVLAIINENAGLLEDLVFMAADQHPVDPERVAVVAGKIRQQVRRADVMIKRLNQVGHSVDRPLASVNLADIVENMCALADRKAAMKAVTIKVLHPPDPITVKTDPFSLQQFFWQCLDEAIGRAKTSKKLEVNVSASPAGADIVFGPMQDIQDMVKIGGVAGSAHFIGKLRAELIPDRDKGLLTVRLPFDVAA